MDFEDLENMFPYMKYGRSKPKNCKSEQRIAVIVPYRDRLPQLKIFLLNLIPFLHRQNADFTIFIVEQVTLWFLIINVLFIIKTNAYTPVHM